MRVSHFPPGTRRLAGTGKLAGPAIGWDKDSTLFSTLHRQPMVERIRAHDGTTWEDYSLACVHDEPIPGAVALMRLLAPHYLQVVFTGSSEVARPLNEELFAKYDLPVDELVMRPDRDHTPNGQFKVRKLRERRAEGLDVQLFLEDWQEAAEHIAAETGIPVLGVNPFYPDQVLVPGSRLPGGI